MFKQTIINLKTNKKSIWNDKTQKIIKMAKILNKIYKQPSKVAICKTLKDTKKKTEQKIS